MLIFPCGHQSNCPWPAVLARSVIDEMNGKWSSWPTNESIQFTQFNTISNTMRLLLRNEKACIPVSSLNKNLRLIEIIKIVLYVAGVILLKSQRHMNGRVCTSFAEPLMYLFPGPNGGHSANYTAISMLFLSPRDFMLLLPYPLHLRVNNHVFSLWSMCSLPNELWLRFKHAVFSLIWWF